MKRALVTGAGGFVGSHLVKRLLRDEWTVDVVARPRSDLTTPLGPDLARCKVHPHDGSTEGLCRIVETATPEVVFHLASLCLATHAPAQIGPLIGSNVLFSTQLVEASVRAGVRRFVNAGTSWQHFDGDDYVPVCLYAATKEAFEKILEYYTNAEQLRAITLYLFDTYGPNDHRRKLLRLLEDAARNGSQLDMSEGKQRIDLTYIDDVVQAFVVAAQRLADAEEAVHEQFAVCSNERYALRDIVPRVQQALGCPVKVNWGARPYRTREVMEPWSPKETLPGWTPAVPLEEGLLRMFEGTGS